jgi:hypothetical protein
MLLIGILVPFAGAIIRYRSIYLPFLLAPFLDRLAHYPLVKRINARLLINYKKSYSKKTGPTQPKNS